MVGAMAFGWAWVLLIGTAVAAQPEPEPRRALEARVAKILAQDNVSQRSSINDVFQLADLYAQEDNVPEAIRLYEAGLRVDSWRWDFQLKLARLLQAHGRQGEAVEKAQQVVEYAEDPRLVEDGRALLSSLGIAPPESRSTIPAESTNSEELVLVPVGGVRRWLLEEVRPELQQRLGLQVSIAPYDLELGPVDRSYQDQFVQALAKRLEASMPLEQRRELLAALHLRENDLNTAIGRKRFVDGAMQVVLQPEAYQQFLKKLEASSGQGQYDADRLVQVVKTAYPNAGKSRVLGYLSVTEVDIFNQDNNFLFGWAQPGYGVMSYHRFLASTNDESPNRPRLRQRLLKQAISSAFFVLGIPRCTSPVCVRAYPHSLTEHDQKGTELCAACQAQLRAKLQRESRRQPQ